MTDEQLAQRIASRECGDEWADLDERTRAMRIEIWIGLIEEIRFAGLAVVEAEDGR